MDTQLTKREQLIERILRLPEEQVDVVTDFLERLPDMERHTNTFTVLVSVPISRVMALRGLIHVGGDALEDTKRLYD